MRHPQPILRAVLAAALLAALPARAMAPQVMTYSGYLKDSAGGPVTAATTIVFRLYGVPSGGAAVWSDTVSVTPGSDGWFSAVLGTVTPLPFDILNQDLYLSLQVNADAEFSQRARVTPSHAALTVDWSGVQGKPTCAAGAYLTLDAASGGLLCTTPAQAGTITGVTAAAGSPITVTSGTSAPVIGITAASAASDGFLSAAHWTAFNSKVAALSAGPGLVIGGTATVPTVGLATCADGQVLKYGAALGWACAADANSGTITAVAPGAGLTGGGASGAVTLSVDTTSIQSRVTGTCGAGQKVVGVNADGSVTCATDVDTTYAAGAGMVLTGTTFGANFTAAGGRSGSATTVARGDHTHTPLATIQLRPPDFYAEPAFAPLPTLGRVSLDGNAFTWRAVNAWTLGAGGALTATVQVPGGVGSATSTVTVQLTVAGQYPAAASTDVAFGIMAISAPGTGVINTWSDYRTTGAQVFPAGGTQAVTFNAVGTYSYRVGTATPVVSGDTLVVFIRNNPTSTGPFHLLAAQLIFN